MGAGSSARRRRRSQPRRGDRLLDPDELAFLEGVLHPRVGVHVLDWRQNLGADVEVAVVEVPPFEAAMEGAFDATVAVVAGDEIREARLRERASRGSRGGRAAS